MQHPISERINFLVNHYTHGNVSSFADKIGLSRQALNRLFHPDILSKKYPSPSLNILTNILDKFSEVDANWLMTGMGSPFRSVVQTKDDMISNNDKDWKSMYFEVLDEKDVLTKKYMTLLEKIAKP
ncbi:hypothetical protein [Sphingobacterium siyangense]|uniref:hypothetical protein n=1 Tax=Sphingobacterium siyangense TaxID=459529 RepID=UPI003DA3FC79